MAILAEGFRDATGCYGTDRQFTGVWLSDIPLDENEGTAGADLLEVMLDLPDAEIIEWEWGEEGEGVGYREFLFPAAIVNAAATVRAIAYDPRDRHGPDFLAELDDPLRSPSPPAMMPDHE